MNSKFSCRLEREEEEREGLHMFFMPKEVVLYIVFVLTLHIISEKSDTSLLLEMVCWLVD